MVMPVSSVVTFETVSAAVEALAAEKRRPTTRAVQEKLGGGSLSTIHVHLKKIKADTPEISLELEDAMRPVLEAVAAMAKAIHEQAGVIQKGQLKDLEDDVDRFSKTLLLVEGEKQTALERIKELERQVSQLQSELQVTKDGWKTDKEMLQVSQNELAQVKNRSEDWKAAREEVVEYRANVARLEERISERDKEIVRLKEEKEAFKSKLDQVKEQMAKLEGRLEERDSKGEGKVEEQEKEKAPEVVKAATKRRPRRP
jgi:chromosome segregation ATPase